MIVIFADASWWEGAGGYAYWSRCDGEEKIQGAAPWPCSGIDEVETVGLCVGMMDAIDRLPNERGVVVCQSDSLHALGLLRAFGGIAAKTSDRPIIAWGFGGAKDAVGIKFAEQAMSVAHKAGVKVYLKHVKGHTGKDEARSRVNEWCDREAKKARRACAQALAAAGGEQHVEHSS